MRKLVLVLLTLVFGIVAWEIWRRKKENDNCWEEVRRCHAMQGLPAGEENIPPGHTYFVEMPLWEKVNGRTNYPTILRAVLETRDGEGNASFVHVAAPRFYTLTTNLVRGAYYEASRDGGRVHFERVLSPALRN